MKLSNVFAETVERTRNAKIQDDYIDFNIPVTSQRNPDTYVLIIANQHYDTPLLPEVPYATNDGYSMREYFTRALGVPQRQVKLLNDASKATIEDEGVHWLTDLAKAVAVHKGDETSPVANIIIYYAGLGFTDLDGKAYLVPNGINTEKIPSLNMSGKKCPRKDNTIQDITVQEISLADYDITLSSKETSLMTEQCISLDALCASLAGKNVPVRNLTLILDASFDGNNRDGNPAVRPERKDAKKKNRKANLRSDAVVLLAADFNNTAYVFDEREHGFLTYFLLKEVKLQRDRIFSMPYEDILTTVERKVSKESALQNRWQELSGIAGGKYKDGDWKKLKVKN